MPKRGPEHPLPLLGKHLAKARQQLLSLLLAARRRVIGIVHTQATTPRFATSGIVRETAFRALAAPYNELARGLGSWIDSLTGQLTFAFAQKVAQDLAGYGVRISGTVDNTERGITEFSRRHAERTLKLIAPEGAEKLIAVQTDRMKAQDLSYLRTQVVEVMRLADLTGMTAREVQRELERRMLALVEQGLPSWQFIDKAGKAWKAGNYFDMLVRTLSARVAREAYVQRLVDMGFDLCSIEGGGSPCPVCADWRGIVVSLTGATKGFPTLAQAQLAGVFHPNCVCEPRYVDELADKDQIEASRGSPPDKPSKEALNKYVKTLRGRAKTEPAYQENPPAVLRPSPALDKELVRGR